jgi:haloacetate dehalogenase
MTRGSAGLAPFDPRALVEYERALALRGTAHGICENYRSSAGIDLEHDRADRERGVRVSVPLLALWGRDSVVYRCFQPLDEWKRVASDVRGGALPCGHHIAEEAPDALLVEALPFLTAV